MNSSDYLGRKLMIQATIAQKKNEISTDFLRVLPVRFTRWGLSNFGIYFFKTFEVTVLPWNLK